MDRNELTNHLKRLKWLGVLVVLGVILVVIAIAANPQQPLMALLILGMLLPIAFIVYLVLFTIWHWKERYVGEHSNLWGALLVLEASGWFKIFYFFRHILADYRERGRYASPPS